MTGEEWLRLSGGLGIVLAYLHNTYTGWLAAQSQGLNAPKSNRFFGKAIRQAVAFGTRNHAMAPVDGEVTAEIGVIRIAGYYGPYFSVPGALMMALIHIHWLSTGAWRFQEHLFGFCLAHYVMALVLHLVHLYFWMTGRLVAGGAADDDPD